MQNYQEKTHKRTERSQNKAFTAQLVNNGLEESRQPTSSGA